MDLPHLALTELTPGFQLIAVRIEKLCKWTYDEEASDDASGSAVGAVVDAGTRMSID